MRLTKLDKAAEIALTVCMVVKKPTVFFDEKMIMQNGKLLID